MSFWILFWKLTFVVALVAFFALSVWVAIGGVTDIKAMLKKLKDED